MKKLIEEIKDQLNRLDSLYNLYLESKNKSKNARLKKDRERATDSMFSYASMIESILVNPPILNIIVDGNPYQFEDFWKYVDSDLPDYIKKIKARLDELDSSISTDNVETKN